MSVTTPESCVGPIFSPTTRCLPGLTCNIFCGLPLPWGAVSLSSR